MLLCAVMCCAVMGCDVRSLKRRVRDTKIDFMYFVPFYSKSLTIFRKFFRYKNVITFNSTMCAHIVELNIL